MRRVALFLPWVALGLGAAGVWTVACSSGGTSATDLPPGAGGKGGSGGSGISGQSGSGAPTGGMSGSGGSEGDAGSNAFGGSAGTVSLDGGKDALEEGCAGVEAQATRVPLTLYVVLDRSSSSSGLKWDASIQGLGAFLKDPASAGITVGLVTFPRQPLLNPQECSFSNYKEPQVPFAKLPENAQPILDFLATVKPNGFGTPIYPALGGALERAAVSKMAKPEENFAVLLVTDGEPAPPPTTCNGVDVLKIDNSSALVADTLVKYQVKTFVIGLPGIPASFADALAKKGGTQAIVIQQDVDLEKQFQGALSAVLGEGLGCEFPLPPDSSKYDKDLVNVNYTKGDGSGTLDLKRSMGCKDGSGWDYDNDIKPTKLVLCGTTCEQVKKDGLAKINVVLGCPTRIQ
ncbi:MAG: vWA domain-containing protein [Myxococcales bacterium]|nr:VWA domain-containing protein [Polyangiaceae bacterium]MDW8247770.1 vWA domain-containing protein [Myxococcales bacterium]